MKDVRLPSVHLAMTWCATGIILNIVQMTERAAHGLPLIDPPLFWTLLRWWLWILLVPPIVMLAQRTRNIAVHLCGLLAASLAHTLLFGLARMASGKSLADVLRSTGDRFWTDLTHDAFIYAATLGMYWGGKFLVERRAIAIEEKELAAATADADAAAARQRLRPDDVCESLQTIAALLPHDRERAEEGLDDLAQSFRRRIAAPMERTRLAEVQAPRASSLPHLRIALAAAVTLALGGIAMTVVASMAIAAAAFVAVDATSAHRRRIRALALRQRCAEAEARFLRARLEPHFLFNSLNSVAALIEKDSGLARVMLDKLRDFYVASSRAHAGVITVAEELALVESYLFVESVRYRDRMHVIVECDPLARQAEVPSLLLQPLVENSVRHGIARRTTPGEIVLTITLTKETVHARLINDLADDDAGEDVEREGLTLTRSRLGTLYGRRAHFLGQRTAGKFRIDMSWPCAS